MLQRNNPGCRATTLTNKIYAQTIGTTITITQPKEALTINVDPVRLIQVLTNLLSNASKFSTKNGVVSLTVQDIGKKVRISVLDNGPGIPHELQATIFNKFSHNTPLKTNAVVGTGLGLHISKNILDRMGTTLQFISSNKGTTFYFDLPLSTN